MTPSKIRSYSTVAVLALSSLFSFAADHSKTKKTSTQPRTEEICQVHPEYSCVEVPTAYGYQSYKQDKQQKAEALRIKAAQKNALADSASQEHGK
jgi:hypothetical protein